MTRVELDWRSGCLVLTIETLTINQELVIKLTLLLLSNVSVNDAF